jgi:hypothetical protein
MLTLVLLIPFGLKGCFEVGPQSLSVHLQAILSRKLVVDEVYDIMQKVTNLSLTSDSEHVQLQCRQVGEECVINCGNQEVLPCCRLRLCCSF